MRVACLGLVLLGSRAWAGPVTVWLEPELPDVAELERANNLTVTGGTEHVPLRELLYPPTPEVPADGEHIEEIRAALVSAAERWDEFEIELPIATDLGLTLDDVSLVRGREDAEVVARALILQGAAVLRAFEAEDFATDERASSWRVMAGDVAVPRAWVSAYGLMPATGKDAVGRQDLVDTAAWQDWERLRGAIVALPAATITWDPLAGALWVDGQPVAEADGDVEVRPGVHAVHLVRDGAICGRARLELAPGATAAVPPAASLEHVDAAHAAVAAAQLSGLPDDVRAAVTALGERYGGPVFLAAMSGRHGVVVSADGTIREVDRLVTAMLTAEVGGGVLSSQLIEETADGRKPTAAAFSGGVGFELGVSYFLLDVGLDATVTPGRTVAFARAGGDGNAVVSVHPQPHAGLGAYILRPVSDTPTLSIAADVMWSGPAHMVYGGRIAVGVPLDARHNWLRIVAGGGYGPQTLWKLPDDPIREIVGFLRVGLGARL